MIDPAFPALSNAMANSMLWRAGSGLIDALATAWRDSATQRTIAAARPLTNVRTVAWIAAIGGVAALAAQSLVPAYVRPGLPLMWPATAIIIAAAVALGAAAFQRAWPQSRLARLVLPRRHAR